MQLEIFLDSLFGFTHVDGEEDEAFGGEIMADFVDEGGFVGAEAASGGPEFEEDDFAFDGVVGEFFAGGGDGAEAGRRLFVLGGGEDAKRGEDQCGERCSAQEDGSGHHGGNVTEWDQRLSITLLLKVGGGSGDRGKVKVPTLQIRGWGTRVFMDAEHVMDAIQGLGAKLMWITPKTREKWNRKKAT
jgi:hypothetical protein